MITGATDSERPGFLDVEAGASYLVAVAGAADMGTRAEGRCRVEVGIRG